jgi:transcriptional regulator with XRE-family HTH domain
MAAQDQWMAALREQMAKQRLSQRKLAQLSGVNRSTFRKALAGRSDITLNDLIAVLTVLGWEIDAYPVQQQAAA